MPITSSDILWFLSGGSSNSNPNASLGGAISSVQLVNATLNNVFDDVTGDEAAAGDVEFRAIYVKNNHSTLSLTSTKIWILTNTPATGDTIAIGIEGANGSPNQTIANENTAPSSPSIAFSSPTDKASGLDIGTLAPGQVRMIWIRRTVTAGATAYNTNNFELKIEGDTPA